MRQQINLYNPALRRVREWLSLVSVALVALALAVLLSAGGGVLRWRVGELRAQSREVDQQMTAETARLQQLSAQPGAAAAKQDLAALQQAVAARREVLSALQSGPGRSESAAGFADYLRGLARQSDGGVWLSGFSVAQGGQGMEIRGYMTEPAALPDYVRRLNAEPGFHGRRFVALNVGRPTAERALPVVSGSSYNTFVLTAVVAADAGKDKGGAK